MKYYLLTSTRYICYTLITISITIIAVILFFQSILGSFYDVLFNIWSWFFLVTLLPYFAILVSIVKERFLSKATSQYFHFSIIIGTFIYYFFALLTITLEPITMYKLPINSYLYTSYLWFIPFQLILLTVYFLVFLKNFNKQSINRKNIIEFAHTRLKSSILKYGTKESIYELIISDEMHEVFDQLKQIFNKSKEDLNFLMLQEARYNKAKKSIDLKTGSREAAEIEINQIIFSIFDLMDTNRSKFE